MNRAAVLSGGVGKGLVVFAVLGVSLAWLGAGRWYLEVAAHWLPAYALFALAGGAICVAVRAWRWSALALICAGVAAAWAAPIYAAGPNRAAAGQTANLRILQANVWQERGDPAALIRLVRETEPDVILLQEFTAAWGEALAALEEDYPAHYALPRYPGGDIALGMYARGETGDSRTLADTGLPAVLTTLRVAGREIALLNVHTASPWSPGRAKRRHEHMEALGEFIAAHDGPVILSGDLNAGLWQRSYRRLARRTGLVNTRAGHGFVGTWPAFLPAPLRAALDHTLVSPDIKIVDCRTAGGIASDHRPMLVDLRVPE